VGTYAIKWKTSSSSVAVLCVSSTNGDERAKELWVSRMRSEFDSVSPRNYASLSAPHIQSIQSVPAFTYLWRKVPSKLLELLQFLTNIHLLLPIQQQRNNRLCTTRILYRLRREEELIRRLVVVRPVFRYVAGFLAGRVLEEEYYTVQCTEGL